MDKLNRDELFLIAMKLDDKSLIYFSSCSKTIEKKLENVWRCKRGNFRIPNFSSKEEYITLYQLNQIKSKLSLSNKIEEIYKFPRIRFNLKYIPKEFKCMVNLRELEWPHTQLETVPKEIGYLTNLRHLNLEDNWLTNIPKEIGNLVTLNTLILGNNK